MPRAEVGTPKYLANAMKSKGLQRLRWYCQACQKQCRDENGFKCHTQSEPHLRQLLLIGENAGQHISNFSSEFQHDFVQLLSRRFGTKRVLANRVYQEYIQDKHHTHMNATRWVTLSEFVKHLGRTGVAKVDETEKGWFLAWIDSSPKALEKAEASLKKERANMSDEQRERLLIAEQIERAKAEQESRGVSSGPGLGSGSGSGSDGEGEGGEGKEKKEEGLKRGEGEKVVLSFSLSKPVGVAGTNGVKEGSEEASGSGSGSGGEEEKEGGVGSASDSASASGSGSTNGIKFGLSLGAGAKAAGTANGNGIGKATTKPLTLGGNALAGGKVLKRPNVFKMAAASASAKEKEKEKTPSVSGASVRGSTVSSVGVGGKRERERESGGAEMSAAERLILEDQERKRRRVEREKERERR
ncbi:zinc finger rts2 [Pyrrhoderma noxium]|uniref:Zinc finger rts2 n=1 Tax=Pyrrhoderma noxium TaxID=2282107 RepID=A0A286UCP7_9AGAM|nr:zinc finger rts2 [Pyrrhoderma noxium]